ncbi:MAG: hypothetical protein H0U37_08600 [Chloroflexi bacterium]|nr:hypothetical protein [Chloroflexota bacterium]
MSRYYDRFALPAEMRRPFSVYDRLSVAGIDRAAPPDPGPPLSGQRLASVVFTESGLVYLSGGSAGITPVDDGDAAVATAYEAGSVIADQHFLILHHALTCGDEGGDLDDVLYPVKVLGLVASPADRPFLRAPEVVNGYSSRWHSVFGGTLSEQATDGVDPGGVGGMHARSAIAGIEGRFALECEVIVAIPSELARLIIGRRGWLYPLPDPVRARLRPMAGTR